MGIFIWFGAVCPWYSFAHYDLIPIYRLIPLGILVLLLRRPPVLLLLHKRIHQTERWRQATTVGFFGPIGVGAIFYLSISQEYLRDQVSERQSQGGRCETQGDHDSRHLVPGCLQYYCPWPHYSHREIGTAPLGQ